MLAVAEPVQPSVRPLYARARLERRWQQGAVRGSGRLLDAALVPAELAYRAAVACYHRAYDAGWRTAEAVGVPVLSVGNVMVGGTGKTPVAAWLVDELRRRGAHPAILHGGYSADEPRLHRQWHPGVRVISERDRTAAAQRALAAGATVLVLDDGFQHRRLARDVDLVLIPAEHWTPTPRLLPRGPWREPLRALARAHVIAVVRKTADVDTAKRVSAEVAALTPDRPVLRLRLRPTGWRVARSRANSRDTPHGRNRPIHTHAAGSRASRSEPPPPHRSDAAAESGSSGTLLDAGTPAESEPPGALIDSAPYEGTRTAGSQLPGRAIAVAGIGQPDAFVDNAREAGAHVDAALFFPDHHRYRPRDVARIQRAAAGRPIVTTAKDALKLEEFGAALELWILEQEVVVEDGMAALDRILDRLVL